jgi:rfaE bifunctional protein kinase chain/domain
MEAREIAAVLDRMAQSSVLVVGDVMLDEYVWGEVARISPEAPIPVVDVRRRSRVAGGAANAAACVAALGARASLVGVVGEDPEGHVLASMLEGGQVDARLVPCSRPTTVKTRIIARSQQVVRVDSEDRAPLEPGLEDAVLDGVKSAIADADAVVISDYGKGLIAPQVAQAVIAAAAEASKPVVVDPKGSDFSKYRGAAVVTPNVHEAEEAAGVRAAPAELDELASRLRPLLGDGAILITRGGEGMSLFMDGSARVDIPATSRAVYDPTGAGDAVAATLGLAVAQGLPLPVGAELANAAGGVVVEKLGTAVVSREELEGAVEERSAG